MNRKLITIILACLLVAACAALAGCQEQAPSTACKLHSDADFDNLCDNCGAQVGLNVDTPATNPDPVTVHVVVRNDYGKAMENATVNFMNIDRVIQKATVGKDGICSLSLLPGNYTMWVEDLPEFHTGDGNIPVEVKEGMEPITLNILDNTPNGTVEKPFFLGEENAVYSFNTNEALWFIIRAGEGRKVIIYNAGVEVEYDGEVYTPDENGRVEFHITSDDPKDYKKFLVTNKNADMQEIELVLEADLGTLDNPYTLDNLNDPVTTHVVKDGTVYYRFTVTEAGRLTLTPGNANIDVVGMSKTGLNEKGELVTVDAGATGPNMEDHVIQQVALNVEVGDVITIRVSTVADGADGSDVTFTMTYVLEEE